MTDQRDRVTTCVGARRDIQIARAPTAADERDLDAVGAYLTAHGVRNSLRHFDEVESEESVPEIILDVAREEHATLIVLGLHQRPLIKKRLLGSTAESIVLAASCRC